MSPWFHLQRFQFGDLLIFDPQPPFSRFVSGNLRLGHVTPNQPQFNRFLRGKRKPTAWNSMRDFGCVTELSLSILDKAMQVPFHINPMVVFAQWMAVASEASRQEIRSFSTVNLRRGDLM